MFNLEGDSTVIRNCRQDQSPLQPHEQECNIDFGQFEMLVCSYSHPFHIQFLFPLLLLMGLFDCNLDQDPLTKFSL